MTWTISRMHWGIFVKFGSKLHFDIFELFKFCKRKKKKDQCELTLLYLSAHYFLPQDTRRRRLPVPTLPNTTGFDKTHVQVCPTKNWVINNLKSKILHDIFHYFQYFNLLVFILSNSVVSLHFTSYIIQSFLQNMPLTFEKISFIPIQLAPKPAQLFFLTHLCVLEAFPVLHSNASCNWRWKKPP